MTRKRPASGSTFRIGLMLALSINSASVAAGTATAAFTVSAQLSTLSTATCRLDRTTGAVACLAGQSLPTQLFNGYRVQEAGLLAMPETDGLRNYSTVLGAYSSIKLVNFGGLDYLEMTLSW